MGISILILWTLMKTYQFTCECSFIGLVQYTIIKLFIERKLICFFLFLHAWMLTYLFFCLFSGYIPTSAFRATDVSLLISCKYEERQCLSPLNHSSLKRENLLIFFKRYYLRFVKIFSVNSKSIHFTSLQFMIMPNSISVLTVNKEG